MELSNYKGGCGIWCMVYAGVTYLLHAKNKSWLRLQINGITLLVQWNLCTFGHLETNQNCPDYQGVLIFQVSLYMKRHHLGPQLNMWIMQVSLF